MKIIGVTGPTASGKSFVCLLLKRQLNCQVFDADKIVNSLYMQDYLVIKQIGQIVPECIKNNMISKKLLLQKILQDSYVLQKIEDIVHMVIKKKLTKFLQSAHRRRDKCVLLDIPLLFKIKADLLCNKILCLNANKFLLFQRRKIRGNPSELLLHDKACEKCTTGNGQILYIRSGAGKYEMHSRIDYLLK